MVKKVLPPLNDQNQVPNIAGSGEWKAEDATFLSKLAKGLKMGGEEVVLASDINSVPDVWARVLIVRNGLVDNTASIVDEWRGTLALLALAPYYKHIYELNSNIVNIQDIKNNPFTGGVPSGSNYSHIGKILFDVIPVDTMAQGQDWNAIGVLNFNKGAVAVINPYTIVAAARNYTEIEGIRKLPWYEDGFLRDPCNARDMRNEQYAVLSHYLDNLINGIQNLSPSNMEVFNAVIGRLQDFKNSCDAKVGNVEFSSWTPTKVNLNLPAQPVYDKLAQIFIGATDQNAKFDCGLAVRPEFEGQINGGIFADFRVAQSTGKTLSDIRVWNNYSLNSLRQDENLEKTLKKECENEGYLYLTPETIFTEKLVVFAGDNRKLKEHSSDGNQFAYPVNSALLMFMDPKALSTNCIVSPDGDNYKAVIYLELVSETGNTMSYTLEKIYKAKDVVKNRGVPLGFSIWPDIKIENWDQYYLFYDGNAQVNILPKNVFAVKDIRNKLESLTGTDKIKFIDNMIHSHQVVGEEIPIQQTTAVTELRSLKSSPEAVLCNVATQSGGKSYTEHSKRVDVGLILFPDPQIVAETSNQWSVGIDFGTTNSCVYFKENKENPKELIFKNRINTPYDPGTDEEEIEEVMQAHKEFVPSREVTVPFMTILRERNFKETTVENLPFRSNFIYYVDQVLYAIQDLPDDKRPLKFNLKWDEAEQSRTKVQYFVSQAVLQAAVEAAANGVKRENLTFNFSYPEAYNADHLRSFKRITRRAVNVGLADEKYKTQEKTGFETESISSALYFAKGQEIPFTENVVTIDIGGGTSDLSIWQDTKLLWRNSFRLAGKDVLINHLSNNLTLIKEISGNDDLLLESYQTLQSIRTNKTKLANGIELLVNSPQFGEAFKNRFDIISGKEKGKELKDLTELALSGILYYVSQVLNHLIENGEFQTGKDKSKSLRICLGGKASTLYKIVFEDADDQAGLSKMIEKVTGGIFTSIGIVFTDTPKHEVSYGLLVDKQGATDLDLTDRSHETVLGEDVIVGKNKIGIVSGLDADKQWRVKDISQLKTFLKYLQAYSKIPVKLTKKFEGDLEGKINAELKNGQSRAQDLRKNMQSVEGDDSLAEIQKTSSIIEPVFIQGLKQVINEITSGKLKLK
ncbi:hypothetical protein [Candidatus Pelagibacter sp. FZCC0015]|uniref:hypothetical protein n=2 Tax=Candidatus Pelagibacter TaxID=198251 RepID=UPI0011A6BE46|nr:hypothetical protein [Candidatus Pelagibacter sp. FZCC0015]